LGLLPRGLSKRTANTPEETGGNDVVPGAGPSGDVSPFWRVSGALPRRHRTLRHARPSSSTSDHLRAQMVDPLCRPLPVLAAASLTRAAAGRQGVREPFEASCHFCTAYSDPYGHTTDTAIGTCPKHAGALRRGSPSEGMGGMQHRAGSMVGAATPKANTNTTTARHCMQLLRRRQLRGGRYSGFSHRAVFCSVCMSVPYRFLLTDFGYRCSVVAILRDRTTARYILRCVRFRGVIARFLFGLFRCFRPRIERLELCCFRATRRP
jgi:hypothetical protein